MPQKPSSLLSCAYLTNALCEILAPLLQDLSSKDEKNTKTHKVCLIMLIDPS